MTNCKMCGQCCKYILFPSIKEWEIGATKEWLDTRGIKIVDGYISDKAFRIDFPCPQLTADGKCGIQDHKPKVCSDYEPGSSPECSQYKKGGKAMEIQHKQFAINSFKSGKTDDGKVFIEGYANTKGVADRYGDIPTVYSQVRDYVYELKDFVKNPVLLLDHWNSTSNIAGSFSKDLGGYIYEDEIGLKFKAVFSESDFPPVAHARTVYQEGHGKALSIGGNWFFEDPTNPKNLTLAEIFEISLVGVGADPNALTKELPPDPKDQGLPDEAEKGTARNLSTRIAELEESIKAGRVLSKANEDKLRAAMDSINAVLSSLDANSADIEEEKQWLSH